MNIREQFIEYHPAGLERKIVSEGIEDFSMETVTFTRRTRTDITVLIWEVEDGSLTGNQMDVWQKIAESGSDPFVIESVYSSLDDSQKELLRETSPTNQL